MKKIKVNVDIYVGDDKLATVKDITNNIENHIDDYINENLYNLKRTKIYDTVDDMKLDKNLTDGLIAITFGYYSFGDGGGAKYIIKSQSNNFNHLEPLNNGLYASLIIEGENI